MTIMTRGQLRECGHYVGGDLNRWITERDYREGLLRGFTEMDH